MKRITVKISSDEEKVLVKRAKKNLLSLTEQIEDIIRRSCISALKNPAQKLEKLDDKLIGLFSRSRRGRKRKSY